MKIGIAGRAILPTLLPWPDIAPTVAAEKAVDEALSVTSEVRIRCAARAEVIAKRGKR